MNREGIKICANCKNPTKRILQNDTQVHINLNHKVSRNGPETEASPDTGTGSQDLRQHMLLPVYLRHQLRGLGLPQRGDLRTVVQVKSHVIPNLLEIFLYYIYLLEIFLFIYFILFYLLEIYLFILFTRNYFI